MEKGTFCAKYHFGHEEWFFRNEWMIDGWRHTFIQGLNNKGEKFVARREPFDLFLFTVPAKNVREYVAKISSVEALDKKEAEEIRTEYMQCGWFDTMLEEIRGVGGVESALGNQQWADQVLNLRFRMENISWDIAGKRAQPDDSVFKLNHYSLTNLEAFERKQIKRGRYIPGSSSLPSVFSYMRRPSGPIKCTPQHQRMQAALMLELQREFPKIKIVREAGWVDVLVDTGKEILLFEIKPDLRARDVIRQAFGQIMEYAYYPSRKYPCPVRLVIVGRTPCTADDNAYFDILTGKFKIPVSFRVLDIDS